MVPGWRAWRKGRSKQCPVWMEPLHDPHPPHVPRLAWVLGEVWLCEGRGQPHRLGLGRARSCSIPGIPGPAATTAPRVARVAGWGWCHQLCWACPGCWWLVERAGESAEGSWAREGADSSSSLAAMPSSMQMSWAVVLLVQGDKSLLMQFQYGCSVAPPTFVVLKLNTFVYRSLKCIAKTYVLAVIADVNLFVILQRLGEVFHKYVRSNIKILWQAARVENSTVTSQQGTSTLTYKSLVIDGISVPCSLLEMR